MPEPPPDSGFCPAWRSPAGHPPCTRPATPGGWPRPPGKEAEGRRSQRPPQYGGPQSGGQPPIIAAMGSGPARVRPGRIWYLGAVLLVLGGVAWLVFGFV